MSDKPFKWDSIDRSVIGIKPKIEFDFCELSKKTDRDKLLTKYTDSN